MDDATLIRELRSALDAALGWIDAVPKEAALPAMPGFDRDWANSLLAPVSDDASN